MNHLGQWCLIIAAQIGVQEIELASAGHKVFHHGSLVRSDTRHGRHSARLSNPMS